MYYLDLSAPSSKKLKAFLDFKALICGVYAREDSFYNDIAMTKDIVL